MFKKIIIIGIIFSIVISGAILVTGFDNSQENNSKIIDPQIILSGPSKVPQTTFVVRGGISKALILK